MATSQSHTSEACTSIEGTVQEAGLPNNENRLYLIEKAEYAIKFPRLSLKMLPGGILSQVELKQLVMSGLIRLDESILDFLWFYKAEVCFDMTRQPPIPFLSSSLTRKDKTPDPLRRHSLTPFPAGLTKGLLRRPDVIIVKDKNLRWPGQAGADHEGMPHPNNLDRVVEVKFPGDDLGDEQRRAYIRIADRRKSFSVLEIDDCREDGERVRARAENEATQPTASRNPADWLGIPQVVEPDKKNQPAPVPVPVYGPDPTLRPAHVESWTQQVQVAIDSLLEQGANGIRQLSSEAQQHLEDVATWLSTKGEWVRQESQKAWEWVSETGVQIVRWTDEQLRSIWQEVQRYTDLTLEMLRQIDWVQWLTIGAGVVLVIMIGVAMWAFSIPAALVSGLATIIRLALVSWETLVGILSATAVTTAAYAG